MSTTPSPAASSPAITTPPATSYRWVICGLLLFSTTVNYMDRQVISYLKEFFCSPADQGGFGWSNTDFAFVTSFFTAFYAGVTMVMGRVIDMIGTKLGLALSLIVWSVFGILNAFAGSSVLWHVIVRSLFGVGEAGNFPASIKTVAEWFPKRERALATGVFNSGSNIGAMISALFVPWCIGHWGATMGWKMSYILTGSAGFIWLIFWFWLYESPAKQKRLSQSEYDYIHCDIDEAQTVAPLGNPTATKPPGIFSFQGRISRQAFWGTGSMIVIVCLFVWLIIATMIRAGAQFNLAFEVIVRARRVRP